MAESDDEPPGGASPGFICARCHKTWPTKRAVETDDGYVCPDCADDDEVDDAAD